MQQAKLRRYLPLLLIFVFLLVTACQPQATATPTPRPATATPEPVAEETEAAAEETEAAAAEETEAAAEETEAAAAEETEAAAEETEAAAEETEAAAAEETEEGVAVAMATTEATEAAAEETEAAAEETEVGGSTTAIEVTEAAAEETEVAVETEAAVEETEVAAEETEVAVETEAVAEETEAAAEETEVAVETEAAAEETEAAAEETEVAVETEAPVAEETEAAAEETETAVETAGGVTVVIESGEELVVGLAAGLSGEGIAPLGIDIQRGGELAIAARPTVTVDGQEFNVVLEAQDDQCSAEGGQTVANRFVANEDVVGVVGPMCSSACRAAAPIFDAAGYSSISPSCTAPDLTTSGFTSFNRAVVSDAFQGRIAADYIYNTLGIRRIATIHDGSAYGEGLVTVVTERFTELGGEVVAADAVNVGDTDFRSLLEDIANEDPELIYFGGFPAEAARIAQQRVDVGLEDTVMMGADGIRGTEVVNLAGEDAAGMYATAALPASSQALSDFLELYVETYGEEPPAPYHANAYDAVNLILDGVEAVGRVEDGALVVDRAALAEYLRSVTDFQGLTGVLNAEGNGETSTADVGISRVDDGVFTVLSIGRVVDGEVVIEEAPAAEATEAAAEATEAAATEEAEATAEATQGS